MGNSALQHTVAIGCYSGAWALYKHSKTTQESGGFVQSALQQSLEILKDSERNGKGSLLESGKELLRYIQASLELLEDCGRNP